MRLKTSCFLIILITYFQQSTSAQSYGLKFASYEVSKDERTGLNLTHQDKIDFNKSLEISFNLQFTSSGLDLFGYIFRSFINDEVNIDLIHKDSLEKSSTFTLIVGNQKTNLIHTLPTKDFFEKTIKIRLELNPDKDEVIFYVGDSIKSQQNLTLPKGKLDIYFGANQYINHPNTDIPPMIINNIKISSEQNLMHHWPLDEIDGDKARDIINGLNAECKNPIWVNVIHSHWKFLAETNMTGYGQFAVDTKNNRIYFINNDSVKWYDLRVDRLHSETLTDANLYILKGNQAFFNPLFNRIHTYSIDRKKHFSLDVEQKKWDGHFQSELPDNPFYHHNKIIRLKDSALYCFGGYGFHNYRNELFCLDINNSEWSEIPYKGDTIGPRYLAAGGLNAGEDTAYFLGGYGSSKGEQIINPGYYYELLSYSFTDSVFRKQTVFKNLDKDFSFANSLVIDDKNRDYYALAFPNHKYNCELLLIKGSLDNANYETMKTGIPFRFIDIRSFADLFFLPKQEKLVAVTSLTDVSFEHTTFKVYSISFPPNFSETEPTPLNTKSVAWKKSLKWSIPVVLLGAVIIGLFFFRKKKKTTGLQTPPLNQQETSIEVQNHSNEQQEKIPTPAITTKPNSIYLLGDLKIFNRNTEDITHFLSPLLKELLLLIVIYTVEKTRGIKAYKLTEILWPDKESKSAKNNRAVNIAKLRNIMSQLDGCSIENNGNTWFLKIDPNRFFCDYFELRQIIEGHIEKTAYEKLKRIIELIQDNALLPNFQMEWLDAIKANFSDTIIDTIINYTEQFERANQPSIIIQAANTIFLFDPVNEEAVILKCKALITMGKHSLAKEIYERFVNEYHSLYAEDYPISYQEMLHD